MASTRFTWDFLKDGNVVITDTDENRTGYYAWVVDWVDARGKLPHVLGDDVLPAGAWRAIQQAARGGALNGAFEWEEAPVSDHDCLLPQVCGQTDPMSVHYGYCGADDTIRCANAPDPEPIEEDCAVCANIGALCPAHE